MHRNPDLVVPVIQNALSPKPYMTLILIMHTPTTSKRRHELPIYLVIVQAPAPYSDII